MNALNFSNYIWHNHSNFFTKRSQLTMVQKLGFALLFACLTGLAAQLRIPLPWTPVPITGQSILVLISGTLLGTWLGCLSQILYVFIGIAGLPWFTNGGSGFAWLIGPTGGYLVGFVLSALFIGYIVDNYPKARNFRTLIPIMFVGNFVFIHVLGIFQLSLWLSLIQHTPKTIWQLMLIGCIPFIIGDIIKIIIASTITIKILPKQQ